MDLHDSSAHQFRTALQYIDKEFPDSEVALILSFLTDDGAYVSTSTEVVNSLVNADTVLELAQQYATRKWQQQEEILSARKAFKFKLVQYLPRSRQLRKHTSGKVRPG